MCGNVILVLWKHIRGCMGTNDDENTVCQRTIDKESYPAAISLVRGPQ